MVIKLIKNDKEYEEALSRIEEIMDAFPSSPEADELELLATLVELYEEKNYRIDLPDPVEAIKFRMEQLDLHQKDLIPLIGSRSRVSEILNKKRELSLGMMRVLHKELNIPAEVLLQESGKHFPNDMPHLEWDKFPLKEMALKGWIPKLDNVKERAEELMRELIDAGGGEKLVTSFVFRKGRSARQNSRMDSYALSAWCLRVLVLARLTGLEKKFDHSSFDSNSLRDIAKLSYFKNGPQLAKEYLYKQGILLVIVPHLKRTFLDGAAMLLEDGTPIVALTLRYDRIDYFWFCLLHELAHVMKHLSQDENNLIIDDLDFRKSETEKIDQIELEADELAKEALIPKKLWDKKNTFGKFRSQDVILIAECLKVHPAIVAGRVRYETGNYRLLSQFIGNGEVRKYFNLEFQN